MILIAVYLGQNTPSVDNILKSGDSESTLNSVDDPARKPLWDSY